MASPSILLNLTFSVISHKQKQLEGILDSIKSRDWKQVYHRQNISNINILKFSLHIVLVQILYQPLKIKRFYIKIRIISFSRKLRILNLHCHLVPNW